MTVASTLINAEVILLNIKIPTAYREAYDKKSENVVECSHDKPPPQGKVCKINLNSFGACRTETGYSYSKGAPCVFLKLNKVSII